MSSHGARRMRIKGLPAGAAIVAVLTLLMGAPAHGATMTLDLRTDFDYKLRGRHMGQPSAAGDVNGDAAPDIIVKTCAPSVEDGEIYVVFGPFHRGRELLAQASSRGFRAQGGNLPEHECHVSDAGDINGDGLADSMIGIPSGDPPGRRGAGLVYVIFGKTSTDPVDLDAIHEGNSTEGFRIDGAGGLAGQDVAAAGDVNGDGFDDLVIGAPFAGATYVVFGKPTPTPVDLLTFEAGTGGPQGFRIDTPVPDRNSGYSVGGAGDTNGDGFDDLVIGVNQEVTFGVPGEAYVVFGKPDTAPVDVSMPFLGYKIEGKHSMDALGYAVDGAGDVNADGLDDVIVGMPRLNLACCKGLAFVIFGKTDTETVQTSSSLGSQGFRIKGVHDNDDAGYSVAGLGDVNGDGLADVGVGAPADHHRGRYGGTTFVVYGKKDAKRVLLRKLGRDGQRGYRVKGAWRGERLGSTVDGPGDVNGDGRADLLLGTWKGKAYLVWAHPRCY